MYIQRPYTTAFWQVLGAAALDWAQNEWQDKKNAGYAQGSRDFQERMSSTSYQRAARDLESAGLNRVLALGQGATTPNGATASVEKPSAVQTGVMSANAKSQIALQRAEENLVGQKTAESKSAENLNNVAGITSATQAQLNTANAKTAEANALLLQEQARKTRIEADRKDVLNPAYKAAGDFTKWLDEKFRSSAKPDKDGWWPTIKKSAKDLFTDDPDSGWYDTRDSKPRDYYKSGKYRD